MGKSSKGCWRDGQPIRAIRARLADRIWTTDAALYGLENQKALSTCQDGNRESVSIAEAHRTAVQLVVAEDGLPRGQCSRRDLRGCLGYAFRDQYSTAIQGCRRSLPKRRVVFCSAVFEGRATRLGSGKRFGCGSRRRSDAHISGA